MTEARGGVMQNILQNSLGQRAQRYAVPPGYVVPPGYAQRHAVPPGYAQRYVVPSGYAVRPDCAAAPSGVGETHTSSSGRGDPTP